MRAVIRAACGLVLLAASGCGGASGPPTPAQEDQGTLLKVGEMVLAYQQTKNKPPASVADLSAVRAMAGNGYEAVRSGQVVLRYGATLPDLKEEPGGSPSDEILAYQKQVPESGGQVLLLNRTVKTVTAEEFKTAKKAGKD